MEMCRIVFSGELLDGFHMQDVQKAAAIRLRVADEQLARLFSGEPTVLKKAVSGEACAPYLAELARMGMKARVESLAPLNDSQANQVTFKVVFWGKTIRGYGKDQVMRAVPRRLRVDEAQLVRLFAGGKAVLKRGLSAEAGARYITELARIGMQVELEIETDSLPVRNSTTSQVFAFNNATGGVVAAPLQEEDSYGSFLQTQVDLQGNGTLLGTNIMNVLGTQDEPPPVPAPPAPIKRTAAETKAQSVERLASAIEQAYVEELGPQTKAPRPVVKATPEARCTQCGHRQSKGDRCDACGCVLARRRGNLPLPTDDMTRSLHEELSGTFTNGDLATLMREMHRQAPKHDRATVRRVNPVPVLIGGACVLAVGGWLLLSH